MRYASISDRLAGLGSAKWAVHAEGRRRKAAGEPLIMLSIGEPDLPPPVAVIEAAIAALRGGRTRYSGGQGELIVRQAVADMMSRRSGLAVSPSDVVFAAGTQQAVHATLTTLVEAGDDVLVPNPFYATYDGVVAATGARFVDVPTLPEDKFHLTPEALERAITPNSRVLLLNTPSNPTGAVLSADELDAIGEICIGNDLWIVCDEVYATMTYGTAFGSPFDRPQLRDRSVAVASISKSHALPGFRCGWAVCPPELAPRLTLLMETMTFGSQPFLADATAVALNVDHREVAQMRDAFQARADAVVRALKGSCGVATHRPEGGMFMFLDVRATGLSGTDFAWRLLEEAGVVVMPGESFGSGGAGHIRVALTVEAQVMTIACERIVALADGLARPQSTGSPPIPTASVSPTTQYQSRPKDLVMPLEALPCEYLFTLTATLAEKPPVTVKGGPRGTRVMVAVTGGSFEGPKLNGSIAEAPGGDWVTLRDDGTMALDVRVTLLTDDGAAILMTYCGIGVRTDGVSKIRTAPLFETGDERYTWLNNVQAVGLGTSAKGSVSYDIYRLL